MLKFNQTVRITALDALNHSYFKESGYVPLDFGARHNQSGSSASTTSTPVSVNSMSCDESRTLSDSPDK